MGRFLELVKTLLVVLTFPFVHPLRSLELLSSGGVAKKIKAAFTPWSYDPLSIVEPVAFEATAAPPTLNVLLPSLEMQHMTGGPNTAILIAIALGRRGVPLRFIATDKKFDPEPVLRRHFEQLAGPVGDLRFELATAENRSVPVRIGANDVFLATAWWTAQIAERGLAATRTKEFLYLVQEFEPLLYPWSVFWKLATDTYGFRFRAVINERFVARYLEEHRIGNFAEKSFLERCAVFEPAVDERVFSPRPRASGRKKRLFFYARVQAPRNLFEWGILALRRAIAQGAFAKEDWDLFLMGDRLSDMDLGHGQRIRQAPWKGYQDYAASLGEADVGLSLMLSPHTSYPPLEMAASGMQVVTNAFDTKTKEALAAISKNVIPVEPDVDAIVLGLLHAHERAAETRERTSGGLTLPRSWDAALAPVLPRIEDMFRELSSGALSG